MKLKVAVIGVGMMGKNHARVYSDLLNVELVAVADAFEQSAESIARKYRCASYTSYTRLLDEQAPDAITIAVPTIYHLEVALEAIQRGVHVLI